MISTKYDLLPVGWSVGKALARNIMSDKCVVWRETFRCFCYFEVLQRNYHLSGKEGNTEICRSYWGLGLISFEWGEDSSLTRERSGRFGVEQGKC